MKLLLLLLLTSCALYDTTPIPKPVKRIRKTKIPKQYVPIHIKQLQCVERFIKLDVVALDSNTICQTVFAKRK